MELTSFAPAPPEPAQFLQCVPLQYVHRHVRVVADVEAGLLGISRKIHRHCRARKTVGLYCYGLLLDETALTRFAARVEAFLTEVRIATVEDLDAVIAAVADINQTFLADLHAVHWIAEEGGLHIALGEVGHPVAGRSRGLVVDRVVAVRAEMTDIFAGRGISDDHSPIAVAIRHIHTIGSRIDRDVGR